MSSRETSAQEVEPQFDEELNDRIHEVSLADGKDVVVGYLAQVEAPYSKWYDVERNGLTVVINRKWGGVQRPHGYSDRYYNELHFIQDIIDHPQFLETTTPSAFETEEDFKGAVRTEITGRRNQAERFKMLEKLIEGATAPEELVDSVDIYGLMLATAEDFEMPDSSIPGIRKMTRVFVRGAAQMCTDLEDGTADPHEIAQVAYPAIQSLITNPNIQAHRQDSKSEVVSNISAGLSVTPGTAESVAGVEIANRLISVGYNNLTNATIRGQRHRDGERYITGTTLEYLHARGIAASEVMLPDRADAVETVIRIIEGVVVGSDDPVAAQIYGAYNKLRPLKTIPDARNPAHSTATIIIANALTPQLNDQMSRDMGDTNFEPLQTLDTKQMDNLLPAFDRVIYAIDPAMLNDMVTPRPLEESSDLRLKAIYLEALMQQWEDHGKETQQTIGDFVMRQLALGLSSAQISDKIARLDRRHPDDRASRHYQAVRRDNLTRSTRVDWNKKRRGYGVIS